MKRVLGGVVGRQEESLAVQAIVLTAARVAGFGITFAIPIVLVRVFDQAQFGIYKQLFLVAATVVPMLGLGLGASLFYFIPRDEGDGHHFVLQALVVLSVNGALAGLGLALGAGIVSRLLNLTAVQGYLPILGLFVFVSAASALASLIPTVDRRPVIAAYTLTGYESLRAIGIIGAAVLLRSLEAVLWAVVAVALLRGFWLLLYLQLRRPPKPKGPSLGDLAIQLRYSLPFFVAGLFATGLTVFHQYYVAANVSTAEFAIYAVGIIQLPVIGYLVQSTVDVTLVRAAAAHKAGDRAEMRCLWTTALERLAVVAVPCWALAEIMAPDLIGLLFGPAYQPSVPIFRIFLITVLLLVIVDHSVLRATGDTPYVLAANALGFGVSAIAVVLLTQHSVLVGGVTGYVVGLAATRCMGLVKIGRRLELAWTELLPWRTLARVVGVVAASSAVAALGLAVPDRLLRLAMVGLIFFAVYSAVALRWELVPRHEVSKILRRFIPAYYRSGS